MRYQYSDGDEPVGGKGDARGRRRKTEVHKQCVQGREQVTEQESESVFVCVWERNREREKQ